MVCLLRGWFSGWGLGGSWGGWLSAPAATGASIGGSAGVSAVVEVLTPTVPVGTWTPGADPKGPMRFGGTPSRDPRHTGGLVSVGHDTAPPAASTAACPGRDG